MQLSGPGVFGPPRDHDQAIAVLRRAVELGVDHIDTSQYYGPDVVNELIRRPCTRPRRSRPGQQGRGAPGRHRRLAPYDEPDQLRAGIEDNLRALGVERLTAVNLRLMDGAGPGGRFTTSWTR